MSLQEKKAFSKKPSLLERVLNFVENTGNKLWDPVTLFMILCAFLLILSWVLSQMGAYAIHPMNNERIEAINLLSKSGLQQILSSVTSNFQSFPPLGLVIIVMMGAGLADRTGLMTAAIKQSVVKVPENFVTAMIVLIGINAVAVGDAGFVVLPPLAALVYMGMGRHPLAGLYTAYASVAAGFAACLMVQMGDVVAASFTIPAAQMMDTNYVGTPAMNFYFMFVSTFVLLPVGVYVNNKIIEPRLGKYEGKAQGLDLESELTKTEQKGLKYALWSALAIILSIAVLCIGKNAFMADPETNSVLDFSSPLMQGIVPLVTLVFLIPGIIYGKVTGSIKNDKDVVSMMSSSVSELGPYIVLAFAASQFITLFNWSNIGAIMSIRGAQFLENIGFTGVGLIIAFVALASVINIFVGSAGAKWAMMAPIFVPMFMLLDYNPALTQIAYRIGDSITNPLSPLFPYFPILVGFAQRYDKDAGVGSFIANMLPYSVAFAISWVLLLIAFIVFNIPLGPGAGIYY